MNEKDIIDLLNISRDLSRKEKEIAHVFGEIDFLGHTIEKIWNFILERNGITDDEKYDYFTELFWDYENGKTKVLTTILKDLKIAAKQ